MFQGIIFDFNGVLWWDSALHEIAWRQFALGYGVALTEEDIAHHIHGRYNGHTLSWITGRSLSPAEVAALAAEKEAVYRALCLAQGEQFRLSPGAVDLLDALAARGIPRTIATASGWPNVAFFIEHLALARWFTPASIVYDDGQRPGKPAPDLFLAAAQRLGLAAAQCVIVEDSVSGLAAAHAAGGGWVVALGPAAAQPRLAALPGVHQVITQLSELDVAALFGG
ncbi:MAG: HAD family phosphatase [Anaerolineae bacterium]|jgi:HAD superfamily hydrolase (TIGR01509 family)|nr:HAD family phosphatase [Anaerolineae bacterium]